MRIGIDLGGTKIEAIALDENGRELWRRRVPTPAGNYTETLTTIRDLVLAAESQLTREGSVGIGTPGAISTSTGLIKNSNSVVLNGKPLDRDLAECLARPVRLENDANCFALSEAIDGAASASRVVFGVILGTGVGGGLVVDKTLVGGRNRIAGEWGHNPLPWHNADEWPGQECYCGKRGCVETFLSGAGLSDTFRDITGKTSDAANIAAAADASDRTALECLAIYQDRLARSLAVVIKMIDPDMIVLGGGLSNIEFLYRDLVSRIEKYAFSDRLDTKVVRNIHGDSSGVRGAAWLWPASSPSG